MQDNPFHSASAQDIVNFVCNFKVTCHFLDDELQILILHSGKYGIIKKPRYNLRGNPLQNLKAMSFQFLSISLSTDLLAYDTVHYELLTVSLHKP